MSRRFVTTLSHGSSEGRDTWWPHSRGGVRRSRRVVPTLSREASEGRGRSWTRPRASEAKVAADRGHALARVKRRSRLVDGHALARVSGGRL
jgi:hypothetical protein